MVFFLSLLIIIVSILSIVANKKQRKRIKALEEIIEIYDNSSKVIKNCVLYMPDAPLSINADGITIMNCTLENLQRTPATKALKEVFGVG